MPLADEVCSTLAQNHPLLTSVDLLSDQITGTAGGGGGGGGGIERGGGGGRGYWRETGRNSGGGCV